MPAERLILIYGRPFNAGHERELGHGPLVALELLRGEHPEFVHDGGPGGGGWWIGREVSGFGEIRLPMLIDGSWSQRAYDETRRAGFANAVAAFCHRLPGEIAGHPLLAPLGLHLVRVR